MELLDDSLETRIDATQPALNQAETVETETSAAECDEKPTEELRHNSEPVTKEEIIATLRRLSEEDAENVSTEELARCKQQFYMLHNDELRRRHAEFVEAGNDPETFAPGLDPLEDEMKQLLAGIKERKAELRLRQEAQREENLTAKRRVIAEIITLTTDTDNINRHHQRCKELQAEFRTIGEVPPQNSTDIWKEYQEAVERFYDQAKINKELYDYDLKKNLSEKQLLIEEAKRLEAEPDIITAFRRLQNLHNKWREIGPVAKELREEVWNSFKDSSAIINRRYQTFFEERKARELENETAKTALCEQVESLDFSVLKTYAEWDEMTRRIIALQEDWRKLGFASKKVNNQLFARFRGVCDKFFAAKAEFYKSTKEEFARNLAAKTALCERAEALKESTDWRAASDEFVKLQRQWKEIGPVSRKQSDAIWKRFSEACDYFFEQKKKNNGDSRRAEQANLKTKKEMVAALRALDADGIEITPDEVLAKIRSTQAAWKEVGHVPFREKDKVYEQLRAAIDALYQRYDLRGQRGRMAAFETDIRDISGDASKINRERERLVRTYEQRRSELQTYENNLGFLTSKSKSGNSMVREIERRVQRLKDDIKELAEKIRLLDEVRN